VIDEPVFVPFRGQHLAASISQPEERPRGLVVLLQGLGAPRSHRYSLWVRTARGLAARGIASVRMDYPEIGDSTGTAPLTMTEPPIDEVIAVTQLALERVGVETFGMAGNCLGAKTALQIASRVDGCASVACILPGSPKSILQGEGRTAPHRAARRLSKRAPKLGSVGRKVLQSHRIKPRLRFLPEVAGTMRRADLMLLYLGKEEPANRLRAALTSFARETTDGERRAVVQLVEAGITSGMRLSLEEQPQVIERIVTWMDETLPQSPGGFMEPELVEGPVTRSAQ
jgi:hypothetical protein